VEIALGDHPVNYRYLSKRGKAFIYEQRWNIYKILRNEYKDNFISVGPLIVSICMLNDAMLVRLDSSSTTETTLRYIWYVCVWCIDVTFEWLDRLIDTVDVKYTRFSNITSEDTIRDSNKLVFNKHQFIDCELLALVFNTKKKKRCNNMWIKNFFTIYTFFIFHPSHTWFGKKNKHWLLFI